MCLSTFLGNWLHAPHDLLVNVNTQCKVQNLSTYCRNHCVKTLGIRKLLQFVTIIGKQKEYSITIIPMEIATQFMLEKKEESCTKDLLSIGPNKEKRHALCMNLHRFLNIIPENIQNIFNVHIPRISDPPHVRCPADYLNKTHKTTRSIQRAQTSLAEEDHYSHIAHCKNVEPWL